MTAAPSPSEGGPRTGARPPGRPCPACQLEQGVGFVGREPGRVRLQDGVVRRRGTHLLEKRTPVLEGAQELGVVHERSTVLPPELLELLRPPGRRDLEHRVGTKAGYHAALPPGFLDRTVT